MRRGNGRSTPWIPSTPPAIVDQQAVHAVVVAAYDANDSGDLDSGAKVEAAIQGGAATDEGVVKKFECPVIHVPKLTKVRRRGKPGRASRQPPWRPSFLSRPSDVSA